MASETDPAHERLARLLAFVRDRRSAVIVAQNRPDPDGMASAAALKRLLREKAGLDAVIAASGKSGRAENRATLQFLGQTLHDLASLDLAAFDLRALVDTQPGFGNNSWPGDLPAHLVIDHHPRSPGLAQDGFADIRTDYGATSTMLTEYLRAADIEPGPQLATALLYGIKTDTLDLSRGASPADTAAFLYLYPLANQRLLARIERERLPRDYFVTLSRALGDCRVYGAAALCCVGPVLSPDTLAELADFFLRVEGIRWVLCHGLCEGRLYLSVRTTVRQGDAGSVAAAVLENLGQGGGHDMLAGGQAPVDGLDPKAIRGLGREIELRFLRFLEVPTRSPERLVPEPKEPDEAEPSSGARP